MSRLRHELQTTNKPCMSYQDAFFRVMQAVGRNRKLIHGRLHNNGDSCAIGCTFNDGVKVLPITVIDEVAAYNDSFPKLTPQQRWKRVMSWLRWKNKLMSKPRR